MTTEIEEKTTTMEGTKGKQGGNQNLATAQAWVSRTGLGFDSMLLRKTIEREPPDSVVVAFPPLSLDLWTASHGRFAHELFTKNEIRGETIKKKEGGATMELNKLGHLLDLMGQAQIIEEKERAFESEIKYSSLMEGLQFKERGAWAYAKDTLQKSDETLSKHVVLIGGGYSADEFMWTRLTVAGIRLCFLAKSITQNRAFDPGGSSSTSGITWSLYFKLWDPGGIYFSAVHFIHLEDKVNLVGGVLLGPLLMIGPLLIGPLLM